MIEAWKPVVGYEGYYEVSNLGNVRSVPRTLLRKFNGGVERLFEYKSKILKPTSTKFDYLKYGLSRGGKVKSILGHRLVAEAWLPNPCDLPVVHHKDHNKHNNSVENLEWVTYSANTRAAVDAGRHHAGFKQGLHNYSGKFSDDQIQWMKKLHSDGYSYTDIEKIFNTNRAYISQVLNGKRRVTTKNDSTFLIKCKPKIVPIVCPN